MRVGYTLYGCNYGSLTVYAYNLATQCVSNYHTPCAIMQLLSACSWEHLRTCINMSSCRSHGVKWASCIYVCRQIIKCQKRGTIAKIKECGWIMSILDKRRSGQPTVVGSAQCQGSFPKGLSG